ncbi:MAG: hypothetical protein M3Q71_11560 [Chloroflexota bacterium]|nr:hypothetical protein [Chloroflexota bacterium]
MRTRPLPYVLLVTGQVDPAPSPTARPHVAPPRHRSAGGYLPRRHRRHRGRHETGTA